MQDEGLHEIQLNGKQLVFLFMAATVAAVVIFLCGVMVGRGVVPERAASDTDLPDQAFVDPTAGAQPSSTPAGVSDSGPLTEKVLYPQLLEDPNPPAETLKPAVEAAPPAPSPTIARARVPAPAPPAAPKASDAALKEPSGQGFVVQVAAVRKRAEAETMARASARKAIRRSSRLRHQLPGPRRQVTRSGRGRGCCGPPRAGRTFQTLDYPLTK